MSLVKYSSSEESDTEDVLEAAPIIPQKPNDLSISSFLPPPKNRAPPPIPKSRALGSGIKQRVSSEIAHNQDGIVLPKSNRAITSFVPTSLRGKVKTKDAKAQTRPIVENKEPPTIQAFQKVKTGRPKLIEKEQVALLPITQSLKRSLDDEPETEPKMKELKPEEQLVKEFNVNMFYQKNLELKEKGELRENKHLHMVTNHKNQLTSLMKNAAQDEALLRENFERNKKIRKKRGERYGW